MRIRARVSRNENHLSAFECRVRRSTKAEFASDRREPPLSVVVLTSELKIPQNEEQNEIELHAQGRPMSADKVKFRFPGLNGIRALAALGVTVHHIEQIRTIYHLPGLFAGDPVYYVGYHSVIFFFALSGFLITYLLLLERKKFGSINVPKFYVRRALRIWPLYYLIMIFGLVVLQLIPTFQVPGFPSPFGDQFWPRFFWFGILSAHVAVSLFPSITYASALWSVGVEEWFYAVWPWAFRLSTRWITGICLALVAVLNTNQKLWMTGDLGSVISYTRFDCMAMGALGAILLFESESKSWAKLGLKIIHHWVTQLAALAALAYSIWTGATYGHVDHGVYTFLITIVIVNVASNPRAILKLRSRILDWLGEVSYGLYLYNWPCSVFVVVTLLKYFSIEQPYLDISIYVLTLALMAIVSKLSYMFIERPFLRIKERSFSRVQTTSFETPLAAP